MISGFMTPRVSFHAMFPNMVLLDRPYVTPRTFTANMNPFLVVSCAKQQSGTTEHESPLQWRKKAWALGAS